jgi:glycosyltransferase involved in cell wall biosynthesis
MEMLDVEIAAGSRTDFPLVSVIIPSYNHARFLGAAIDSALEQTYPNIEVVVVDDGSSDNSVEVALAYGERIRLIQQLNSGVSAARNNGIRFSTGSILAMLDADDVMHPTCIADRIRAMIEDPEVGIVAGAFQLVDENLVPFDRQSQHFLPSVNRESAYHYMNSPNIGLLIRRRAIELCGYYDPLLKAAEDWDCQIRICRRFKHVFVPIIGADYRQLPGSLSRDPITMFDHGYRMLRKNLLYETNVWKFRWHALIGLYNHTANGVFGRVKADHQGSARLAAILNVIVRRPITLPFLVAVVLRFAKNKVIRRP